MLFIYYLISKDKLFDNAFNYTLIQNNVLYSVTKNNVFNYFLIYHNFLIIFGYYEMSISTKSSAKILIPSNFLYLTP